MNKREDYTYLMYNLSKAYSNCRYVDNVLVDLEGNPVDEDTKTKIEFLQIYLRGFRATDPNGEDTEYTMGADYPLLVLCSYDMFNFFINTCISEYCVYGDVGTGKVLYFPYQPVADAFFHNNEFENAKEILMNYLRTELKSIFDDNNYKRRVKA